MASKVNQAVVPKSGSKTATASKTKADDVDLNEEIALLLQLASAAPVLTFAELKSASKLYELAILAELLFEFQSVVKGQVILVQPTHGKHDTFAGAPASANKQNFSWFKLLDAAGTEHAEVWVSVQFVGLSATLATQKLPSSSIVNFKASSHELDISLLLPEPVSSPHTARLYPTYTDIMAAISVKHVAYMPKESVREALGFRREMGYLRLHSSESTCSWLQLDVPCDPPSPLFLVASAENFEDYDGHIDELGIYAGFLKFPY